MKTLKDGLVIGFYLCYLLVVVENIAHDPFLFAAYQSCQFDPSNRISAFEQ